MRRNKNDQLLNLLYSNVEWTKTLRLHNVVIQYANKKRKEESKKLAASRCTLQTIISLMAL